MVHMVPGTISVASSIYLLVCSELAHLPFLVLAQIVSHDCNLYLEVSFEFSTIFPRNL